VAIVKVALRQREQLATLRVREDVLVLNTMLWPDEIRTPDFGFLDEPIEVRRQELAMAASLIDSMAGQFDADAYSDNYREALQEVIDAKVSGREIVPPPEEEAAPAPAVDLMAALKASVDRARAARGEPDPDGPAAEPTPISAARSRRGKAADEEKESRPAGKAAKAAKAPARKAAAKKTGGAAKKSAPAKKATKARKSA
jgi:DNA end-binding protein Ku